jgi:hypothetical protein
MRERRRRAARTQEVPVDATKFRLDEAVALLERTPATLDALLRGMPVPWLACDEGLETWSPYVVVGHLIHGEKTDWIPRARRILDDGEKKAFDPFDRFAQLRDSKGKTLAELLDEFSILRRKSLDQLAELKLGERDLERRGRHPELGAVTLGELLATWAVHDLDHVQQIARVMAKRWGDACGPWKKYLRVVREPAKLP